MSQRDLPGAGSALRARGAEGGSAIRAHDWAATPLGPRRNWPDELRALTSLCEGSALPLALAWGPRHVLVANDAWLLACDPTAPSELGRDVRATRLFARPGMAEAYARSAAGTPSCAQASSPLPEQAASPAVAHSFSPIRDAGGEVSGVFLSLTPLPGHLGEDSGRPAAASPEPLLREVAALTLLHEMTVQLAGTASLRESLQVVVETLVRLHEADFGLLCLHDPQSGRLVVEAAVGFTEDRIAGLAGGDEGLDAGACGNCFTSGRRTVVHDVEADPRFDAARLPARRAGFRSLHSTPILTRTGEILGVLSVQFAQPRRPSQSDMQIADMCARHAADAVEAARARAALQASIAGLQESQEALRDADRRKDEFLATLAHELRNPLAPLRTALQVLRLSRPEPSLEGVQAMMERQVAHMVRLVEDLTEVSRITRGKISLRRARVDVATLVRGAVETSQPLLDGAHHRLHVTLPPERLFLDADAVRLVQVLANLLNNAARYTEDAGDIWVDVTSEGDEAVIRVRDNGMGIAAESLQGVFELFTQGQRASRRPMGGLGIGLTLVRSLVEMHGGSVEARSEGRGKGSEFTVRLPLSAAPEGEADATAAVAAPAARPLAAPRVLVVDDNDDAAQTLGILLRLLGAEPRLASCGDEALHALDAFTPDLVILDLGLPTLDGHEVARRIRARPEQAGVTLAALTGWGTDHDRRTSAEAGFDYHFVKPLELRDLHGLLSAAAQKRRPGGGEPGA